MRLVRALTLLMAALAGLALATPAAAQLGGGRSGSSTMSYMTSEESWLEVVNFGRCYATRNTEKALRLIATDPGTKEEAAVYRELFGNPNQNCLGRGIEGFSAPYQMMRGSIGDGLYYARIPLPPAMLRTAPERNDVMDLAGAARCYVKANEAEARALAETRPGSRAQDAMMQSVVTNFLKCMPSGARLNYPDTLIRFRIVEALFLTGVVREKAAGN